MSKVQEKEIANSRVRIFASTHRKLKIRSAELGITLAELIKMLEAKK